MFLVRSGRIEARHCTLSLSLLPHPSLSLSLSFMLGLPHSISRGENIAFLVFSRSAKLYEYAQVTTADT